MSVHTTDEGANCSTGARDMARVVPAPSGPGDRTVLVSMLSQHGIDVDAVPLNQENGIPSLLSGEPRVWQLTLGVMLIIWALIRAI